MMARVGSDQGLSDQGLSDQRLEVTCGTASVVARPDRPVVIGRGRECDLIVDDPAVSRRHAEVAWVDGGWVVRDLGSTNGIWLDGTRGNSFPVRYGLQLRIGGPDKGPTLVLRTVPATVPAGAPAAAPPAAPSDVPAAVSSVSSDASLDASPEPAAAAVVGRTRTAEHQASDKVRIGRHPENEIVLSDLRVSGRHAELRRSGDEHVVVDLGSRHGTYLNGTPIRREKLSPGDMISIGRHELVFDGQRLHEYEDTGPVSLSAERLTVQVGRQVLLDDVSFALEEGSLLAVVGPSGCGKSTLVRAVTGIRPASQGRVNYDGRDLYADYAELRYRIGLVPQDDVLHRQLTVRRALRFAASLRFADDVPRKERRSRVDEVLATLGLTERARQRIDTLSGGQRKRTSVALELLTEPSMLFLDEPTSGLDPALDKEVMEELRELADRGRTVIVVTHNVLHLDLCDRVLVLGEGGKLGYFGPPDELLDYFGAADYAEVFSNVTREPARWQQSYRESALYGRYVGAPAPVTPPPGLPAPRDGEASEASASTQQVAPAEPASSDAPERKAVGRAAVRVMRNPMNTRMAGRALHPAAPIRQFITLCLRMVSVISSDRGYSFFLLGLPLALALLTRTVPGDTGLAPPTSRFSLEAQRLLVVLVVGAAFLGVAVAIREIVSESSIYRRERAVGLSPSAYLASKLAVFTVITTVQVILFVYLSLVGRGAPKEALVLGSPTSEVMMAVALVAVASTVLGLLVSALARTTEQTTPVLVVLVMAQLVLSGGLFELFGQPVLEQVAWLSPTRWGFAAGAATVDLRGIAPLTFDDPLWTHSATSWWRAVLLMVAQAALLAVAARFALRRMEPGR